MNLDNQRGGNPLAAALFGFALGAVVGSMAVVFKSPENRQAVRDAAGSLDRETRRKAGELQKMIADAQSAGKTNLANSLKRAADQLEA